MCIRKLRQERHLSRAEFARRAKIDYATLTKLEKGEIRLYPGWKRRLAEALGVPEEEIDE